ncbi:GNAT family N-acetyltransferase [Inhella sp.]|uniref:GNAT family N-acetyltransferase n=1 Tax=Inhella sp. TaxID=1921806 RepID=UPI0035B3890E
MKPVTIRPLQASDCLQQLTALLHAAYASLVEQGWNFTAANQSVETTRSRIAEGLTLVAVQEARLVGTVSIRGPKRADETYIADAPPALYTEPGTAILSQLAVHPELRGQGLAERLMDAAEDWAQAQGFAQVALDTAIPAQALRRRYLHRGYVERGGVQWRGKTYASVLMSKPLTPLEAA